MGLIKIQSITTILPCSKDRSFPGPRYMCNRHPWTIITGGEGFALPFMGTHPHDGDENEKVGDEVNPCRHKQGSLLHVRVRMCQH